MLVSSWLLLLAALLTLPGCGGCSKAPDDEEQAKKEKQKKEKVKPKDPFEIARFSVRPADNQRLANLYKPGHWASVTLADAKANNFDFFGDMEVFPADRSGNPAPLTSSPHQMVHYRPIALPKGQAKSFEGLVWVPPAGDGDRLGYWLADARHGGRRFGSTLGLSRMASYCYHFVVLARWPNRYEYLDKKLDSIRLRATDDTLADLPTAYYHVVRPPPGRRVELPSHALCWTSIACVLWDDDDPSRLDPDQQQALIDWLHWGGQLILSGPDTLDTLRDSFLGPYLPATSSGARQFTAADLAGLARFAGRSGTGPQPVKPWAGVQLEKHPRARYLEGTDNLFVERAVGRGRVVASAIRLTGPDLTGWAGYDSLFNACLLRHAPRTFSADRETGTVHVNWAGHEHRLDARITSNLRYFARDEGVAYGRYANDVFSLSRRAEEIERELGVSEPDSDDVAPGPGVAAWNDFSPVANAARECLRQAAGIKVPERSFIVWVLAVYLLVLVPGNWALFRLAGRVEWAWAAAPVIALACTAAVIHLAQLNIGFARSRNEIAVVELQADYPRAHVARFTALYTSLGTRYRFHGDDPGALVLPLAEQGFRMLADQSRDLLTCDRAEGVDVSGFSVPSNAIRFVHSEHLADLGGGITLSESRDAESQVVNRTRFALRQAQVVRKDLSGRPEVAWIGDLGPGGTATLRFQDAPAKPVERPRPPKPAGPAKSARTTPFDEPADPFGEPEEDEPPPPAGPLSGELSLGRLTEIAADAHCLRRGEVRLVGVLGKEVPGVDVEPVASQYRQAALVVAHLDHGPPEPPRPDANVRVRMQE